MSNSSVAVSAPGKVLFAGGFLVLDRQHTGLVFGLDARIHVHAQLWSEIPEGLDQTARSFVLVQSPQFREAKWLYTISSAGSQHASVELAQIRDHKDFSQGSNKFVETALRYTLTYLTHLSQHVDKSLKITILADDDYYSQSEASNKRATDQSLGFTDFGVTLSSAHKTGLGSSAALTTAFVAALIRFYMPTSLITASELLPYRQIHNLAQAAHCAAQGKVGSGFDVAAAVYGSCLYRRFSPSILENVGDASGTNFGEQLHHTIEDLDLEKKWDVEIQNHAVLVPESLLLVMCDVDCGSETPGMVRKVLQWRKENSEEASLLWSAIQAGTEDLCQELRRLTVSRDLAGNEYKELADIIQTVRSLVREMSVKSQVPIEPPVITELLDFCTALPGVVGGVAPGAGGYDAVALLIRNDKEVVRDLQYRLDGWKSKDDSGATIGNVRLLGVKQDKEGLRIETASRYESWTQ